MDGKVGMGKALFSRNGKNGNGKIREWEKIVFLDGNLPFFPVFQYGYKIII